MPSPFYTTGPRGLIRALLGTSNVNDIDAGFLALATDVENKMVNYSSGLASAMPAAGTEGRFYRQTDTKLIFFDDGTTWRPVMIPGAWTALTLNPSVGGGVVTGTGTNVAAARREGDTVKLRGYIEITLPPTAPGALYATLPAGTRPLAPVSFAAINPTGSGVTVEQVNIDTSGHLTITDALAGALPIYLEGMNFSLT